jgi:hypothetical protein
MPTHNPASVWTRRRWLAAGAAAAWPLQAAVSTARAALPPEVARMPIFDAHLHYNDDAQSPYPVAEVLKRFERNHVRAVIANSRPNDGTVVLADARPAATTVLPFIRLYRNRADYSTWFADPSIYEMVERLYANGSASATGSGAFRGIGEFHLYESANANGPIAVRLMRWARERGLPILAHVDDVAVDLLMGHAPGAKLIWAHTGFGRDASRVREILEKHPTVLGELSYRSGITTVNDRGHEALTPEWRALFTRFPARFVLGSDTWVNSRWAAYDDLMLGYRTWLALLPREVATQIAWRNGFELFALRA